MISVNLSWSSFEGCTLAFFSELRDSSPQKEVLWFLRLSPSFEQSSMLLHRVKAEFILLTSISCTPSMELLLYWSWRLSLVFDNFPRPSWSSSVNRFCFLTWRTLFITNGGSPILSVSWLSSYTHILAALCFWGDPLDTDLFRFLSKEPSGQLFMFSSFWSENLGVPGPGT